MSLKNPVALPAIDPGIVRLVAQHLNYYATSDPIYIYISSVLPDETYTLLADNCYVFSNDLELKQRLFHHIFSFSTLLRF